MVIRERLPFLLLCFLVVASLSVSSASDHSPSEESEQPSDRRLPWPWKWDPDRKHQENPFHFPSQLFQSRYKSEMGHISLLQRFDKNNRILNGITNYRLLSFEARPQTFVLPHITDADYLIYVMSGKLLFTLMYANHRESYRLERDDVLILPAGALAYVANLDDNQNFQVMHLVIPINIPGEFSDVFPGIQRKPRSFYHGFGRQTLEASFNSPYKDILRALLGEKEEERTDVLVRISKEQIEELSRDAKSSQETSLGIGPFNLRNFLNPYSNNYGRYWEAHPNLLPQLQEFDVAVCLMELNPGSLLLPHLNSKAWVVAYVTQGSGLLEMAAPWRDNEDAEEYGEIQRLSTQLNEGHAFVIPPGYPFAVTASNNNTLRILRFEINIQRNRRIFLAGGRSNVIAQIQGIAKELIFSGSADQVEGLLRNQRQSYFVSAAQHQQQQQGGESRDPLKSILSAFA
ncbi:hypothetical protein L6164_012766 [Bauhinia variegata]|uniref:Uncharacterized protein n=1 Tax=Bauhinia variegata TaxID=167791 RepID=A0ACB9PBF9_BAUVA|nr:hypothetical protein L6164_012766 [Bauhinia variegata]